MFTLEHNPMIKNIIFTVCTVVICSFSNIGLAQTKDVTAVKSAKESLKVAQNYFSKGELNKARKQLLHTIKLKDNFAIAHRLLGRVYSDLSDYEAAIVAYEKSFELDDKLSRAAFFECAEAYLLTDQIDLAQHYFSRFKEMEGKRYANAQKEQGLEVEYQNRLATREQNIAFIQQMDMTNPEQIQVIALGKNINSIHDEYLPSLTSNRQYLLYTRNIKNEDENILISSKEKGQWTKGSSIHGDINSSNNEGMAKFETHGNTFYFAGCKREGADSGCDIYRANFEDGKVTEVDALSGKLNSYYWDSQPSLSCDGQTMYFASTREGGYGGSDIWYCPLLPSGEWGVPENLGAHINTAGDEEAPFISTDGLTLYFTSNGHAGQGNGDLFVSYYEKNSWSIPDNLGYPINSPAKELGIFIDADNETAYFASSRKGGRGGLDIYKAPLPKAMRPNPMVHLDGTVIDAVTQEPIEADIKLRNDGNTWNFKSDQFGWFFQCLAGNKGYSFQIQKEGYQPYIEAVYLDAEDITTTDNVQIALQPLHTPSKKVDSQRLTKTIVQIYFDFDSSTITAKGNDKLAHVGSLLERYDDWSVEVVGFSDASGDMEYNKSLSQKRANEVVNQLKTIHQIDIATNINVIGKGSTGEQSSEEDRRKSRRVDVVMTR